MIEPEDREAIEHDMQSRFGFTTRLQGYCASPLPSQPGSRPTSQPNSHANSCDNTPASSRDSSPARARTAEPASRDGSFNRGHGGASLSPRADAPERDGKPTAKRSGGSKPTAKRRSSEGTHGPGVPEEFRIQLATDGSRTTGSEWRQRIARMLTPASGASNKEDARDSASVTPEGILTETSIAPPGAAPHRPKKRL